jgi:hypothetical protein
LNNCPFGFDADNLTDEFSFADKHHLEKKK